ncbi:replicative helicase [Caudoviricetes sp.]|nr:replicative helicase [Caudoviricetes sp.]
MSISEKLDFHNPPNERIDTCSKHGDFTAKNFMGQVWSKCNACSEELREAERLLEERKRLDAQQRAWENRIGSACIPERFRDRTLDTYQANNPGQEKAYKFAKEYADNFDEVRRIGRCAIFVGNPGTGKTHLAIGIALHVMKQQRSVLFTTVQRAIRRVKDTWSKGSEESESQAINAIAFPDLLILDEVGVQFGSEFEKQVIFDVLNERYEKRKPTILLSNIPAKDLAGYLGDRVADRLKEDGGKLISFDWNSYRRTGQ